MKATERYFPVLFTMLYNEILKCDHSNESNWAVLSCGTVYYAVEGNSNFWVCAWNSVTIQIKATEQYILVVMLVTLYNVVPLMTSSWFAGGHPRNWLDSRSAEFPLVLKSRGPGTSSSMKLGVLFVFQGSSDYYLSFFIFSEFLCLFPKRFSYVICSNYIFSRLTRLALL